MMKTTESLPAAIGKILDENLQLDMPRPGKAKKKVVHEIIELFDQQIYFLEKRIEKMTRLSKKREEFINYLLRRMLKEDREAQRIKNFETDIAFLEADMEDQSEQPQKPEKLPVCKYCGLKNLNK